MVKKISQKEFEQVKEDKIAVIDFSATWCGPCQMIAPVLEEVSDEMPDVAFYNVDVDNNPALAQQFVITNIPALLLLKNGEKADILVGFRPKEDLKNWIASNQ